MLLGYRDADRGHIIEILCSLNSSDATTAFISEKVGETEIDFVAEKPDDKSYIRD